jgi:hypothetical protein
MRPDNFEQYNKTAPNHSHSNTTHNRPQFHNRKKEENGEKDEFSTAISWPIILAVIPTLGAFIGGSADAWSDFIMILLILYYVYKWITGK